MPLHLLKEFAEWSITTTADNAAATVQRAAEAGRTHYITSISAGFSTSQAAAKLLTLKDGATVIGNYHVFSTRDPAWPEPVKLSPGNLAELSLAASGTATQIGSVTMTGFTI